MRKIVKAVSVTLALSMMMSLAACGKKSDTKNDSDTSSSVAGESIGASMPKYSRGIDENGFFEGVVAKDVITMPDDYKAINIPLAELGDISEYADSDLESYKMMYGTSTKITDRAVKDGDEVVISYVGTIDGEPFYNGSATEDVVHIGDGELVDGFETQLIGKIPSAEEFDVTVTFPDDMADYEDEDGNIVSLSGKKVVFKTTIDYIVERSLTDDIVENNENKLTLKNGDAVKTVAQLKEFFKEQELMSYAENYIVSYLIENTDFSNVPEKIWNDQYEIFKEYVEHSAGVMDYETVQDMLDDYGYATLDEYWEEMLPSTETTVKRLLIAQAVAEEQNIKVSSEDAAEYVGEDNYGNYVEAYGENYVIQMAMYYHAINFLYNNAVIA